MKKKAKKTCPNCKSENVDVLSTGEILCRNCLKISTKLDLGKKCLNLKNL